MPAKLITRKREYQPAAEQEQAAPVARRPLPEADEAEPVDPGRPYQAFVENEARKYWREMMQPGSLAKPGQDEIREAAKHILMKRLRRRQGKTPDPEDAPYRAHQAACALQLHALERRWIKHPLTLAEASPDCAEALVELVYGARLGARKIPLPRTAIPEHPPIYYWRDLETGRPRPMQDALIDAAYVRGPSGRLLVRDDSLVRMDLEYGPVFRRMTRNDYIYPVFLPPGRTPDPGRMLATGRDCRYCLYGDCNYPEVHIYWAVITSPRGPTLRGLPLKWLWFARYPPAYLNP